MNKYAEVYVGKILCNGVFFLSFLSCFFNLSESGYITLIKDNESITRSILYYCTYVNSSFLKWSETMTSVKSHYLHKILLLFPLYRTMRSGSGSLKRVAVTIKTINYPHSHHFRKYFSDPSCGKPDVFMWF